MSTTHPPFIVSDQFGFILHQIAHRCDALFASAIHNGLTRPQVTTLATLLTNGPCSQNLLGRLVATDAATIKGIVQRLKQRGFVTTTADPADSRLRLISLTESGRATTEASIEILRGFPDIMLAALTLPERETLMSLMRRLV